MLQSDLWVLVEQLTHKRGPALGGGQDEDVGPPLGVGGAVGRGGAALMWRHHVHGADHVAEQLQRPGREGPQRRVLNGYGG